MHRGLLAAAALTTTTATTMAWCSSVPTVGARRSKTGCFRNTLSTHGPLLPNPAATTAASRPRRHHHRNAFRRIGRGGGGLTPAASPAAQDFTVAAAAWMTSMRVPATLVASAALTSFVTTQKEIEVDPKRDPGTARLAKRAIQILLLSSFILEMFNVFMATVSSTYLLANADNALHKIDPIALSPIGLLHREMEWEYIAMRFTFLQGLFHWLAGIGLKFLLPSLYVTNPLPERELARFHAASFLALVILMLWSYQRRLVFYCSYLGMLRRFLFLAWHRFYFGPLPIAAVATTFWAVQAFFATLKADVDQHRAAVAASASSSSSSSSTGKEK